MNRSQSHPEDPCFEVTVVGAGNEAHFRVYESGHIEGFGERATIVNGWLMAADELRGQLAAMEADRDKYKAFAERYAEMLCEAGIIKDVAAPVPGAVVHLGQRWRNRDD